MKKNLIRACLAATLVLGGGALGFADNTDREGSKDHPLISRYPGCTIHEYETSSYAQFTLPLSRLGGDKFDKSLPLEGKITRIGYDCPAGRSPLEIYRNIESALKGAGFATLFTCAEDSCGRGSYYQNPRIGNYEENWNYGPRYHLTAKLERPEGDVYVHMAAWGTHAPAAEYDIIEVRPMDTGLVKVDAAALAGDITRTGHAAIYGIYFDTGKADIKPESDAALGEISKLLAQDASLKVYVVGHTDNQGMLASNIDLSKRRADAVVKVLTVKYNIAAARLSPQGDGPTAPVASNDSDEGRAKNRRVELVKQ